MREFHGHNKTPTYKIWIAMRSRYNSPSNTNYKNYGGRGIRVCNRWGSFLKFLQDMGERPPKYELDRIDNNKNYSPSNCRWVSHTENNRNKRDSHFITYKGETKTLSEWDELLRAKEGLVLSRIYKLGWSISKAVTTPVKQYKLKTRHKFRQLSLL